VYSVNIDSSRAGFGRSPAVDDWMPFKEEPEEELAG
jgi:hypothetical protein